MTDQGFPIGRVHKPKRQGRQHIIGPIFPCSGWNLIFLKEKFWSLLSPDQKKGIWNCLNLSKFNQMKQECIPVGCVPPTCWPFFLLMHTSWGAYFWFGGVHTSSGGGGASNWSKDGCTPRPQMHPPRGTHLFMHPMHPHAPLHVIPWMHHLDAPPVCNF